MPQSDLEDSKTAVAPAIPQKRDDVMRKRDDKAEAKEKAPKVTADHRPKRLVLDSSKCHVMLHPICKSCRHEWVAFFALSNGDKHMACPKCEKRSIVSVEHGDPRKTRIIKP